MYFSMYFLYKSERVYIEVMYLVEFDTWSYLCQVYKNLHEETQLPIVTHENNDDQKMLCFK